MTRRHVISVVLDMWPSIAVWLSLGIKAILYTEQSHTATYNVLHVVGLI